MVLFHSLIETIWKYKLTHYPLSKFSRSHVFLKLLVPFWCIKLFKPWSKFFKLHFRQAGYFFFYLLDQHHNFSSLSFCHNQLYLGRLQIAFFSVSNEHQEQGAKTRNSRLLQAWATQLLVFMASEKPQFVAFRGILYSFRITIKLKNTWQVTFRFLYCFSIWIIYKIVKL